MPKNWKDILADTSLADTTEITLGSEKVTLGELRAFDTERQGEVAKQLQRATDMQRALEQDQVKAAELLAALASAPKTVAAPVSTAAPAAAPDYMSDPILRPLYEQVKTALDGINTLKESFTSELTGLKTTVQTAASNYINDDWTRRFESMPERNDPVLKPILEKVTLRDALKYAGDHNIVDHRRVPDPVEAARRMTEADRVAAIRSAALEQGKKEGIEQGRKQAFAETPRPGASGRRVVEAPHKNMDEAIDALRGDPEIQEQLAQVQRVQ